MDSIMPIKNKDSVARVSYIEARELARKNKGSLPSNVKHDDCLIRSDDWKCVWDYYSCGAWANELLAYPEKNQTFPEGKDIVDSETGWILPYAEAEAASDGNFADELNICLFVTPLSVVCEEKRVIVHPKSTVVLRPAIQGFGIAGRADEKTRIPLDIGLGTKGLECESSSGLDPPSAETLRWMYRFEGTGVRPIVRYVHDFRRGIFTNYWSANAKYSAGVVKK